MSYADIPDGFQLVDPQQGASPDISTLASAIQTQEGFFPGSRSYRNNNPGNIKFGSFAQNNGATGADDQGHAIFPTYDAGHSALTALLSSPKYAGKSVSQMGAIYAEDPKWAAGVSKILARGQTAQMQPMRMGAPDESSDIPPGFQVVEQDARQSSAPLPPSPTSGLTVVPKGGAPLPQPLAEQPVHATDLLRSFVGQGMGAGFGDEAEAATRAAYDKAQGDQRPFGQIYDAQLDRVRGKIKQFAQDEPFLSTGSEIAGAIAPAIATRGGTAPGSVLNAMGKGALQGAAYGGAYGFGSGEGMPERLIGGGLGAVTGGGVGGLAPLAAEGLVRGGRYIKNALVDAFSPTAGAANRLGSAVAADEASRAALPQNVTSVPKQGLTPQEFADAQSRGQPVTNLERGGENVRALASDAAITSPTARDTLNSTIDQRFEGQGDRITDFVRNLVGGTDATTTRDDLLSQASKANRPAYARAFADPNGKSLWDEGFQQLMTSPDVQAAAKAATRTGANKAAAQGFNPIKNPFVEGADGRLQLRTNPDGTSAAPNLQFWDAVKQNLDDKVSSPYRSGEKGQARDIATLRDTLRNHLDQAVPAYQQARAGAASFFGAQDALEAGQNFTKKNVDIRAAQNAVNKMSNPEKQLFAEGFTDSLIRTVEQAPDRSNLVRKIYGSQDAQNRIRVALGPQRSQELEAFLRTEATIDLVRSAVQGNSKTAQRLAELGIVGGGGAGYGLLTGDHSPGDMFSAAVLTAAAKRGGVALNARVVRSFADMLVSSDPTVYLRGVKTAARNKAFMGALRQIGAPMGSVAAQQRP